MKANTLTLKKKAVKEQT